MDITLHHIPFDIESADQVVKDSDGAYLRGLALLPEAMTGEVTRYHRSVDKVAALCARLLIMIIGEEGGVKNPMENLHRSERGKPGFAHGPHFNLSHCAGHVVAVVGDSPLGVDIEASRPIEVEDFRRALRSEEYERLKVASHPGHAFLELWTRKEAVLKALGCGLGLEPDKVVFSGDTAIALGRVAFLRSLDTGEDVFCHVAAFEPIRVLRKARRSFDEVVTLLEAGSLWHDKDSKGRMA